MMLDPARSCCSNVFAASIFAEIRSNERLIAPTAPLVPKVGRAPKSVLGAGVLDGPELTAVNSGPPNPARRFLRAIRSAPKHW